MRFPLMRRPRVLHLHLEDGHRYVIRDGHGKLIAGTAQTFLADHATYERTLADAEDQARRLELAQFAASPAFTDVEVARAHTPTPEAAS